MCKKEEYGKEFDKIPRGDNNCRLSREKKKKTSGLN